MRCSVLGTADACCRWCKPHWCLPGASSSRCRQAAQTLCNPLLLTVDALITLLLSIHW
jgi:hypothetical protein